MVVVGVGDVLVVPAPAVVVPVPVPAFLGCVVVPVPAPDGTHGGADVGCAGVTGVLGVVPGVGASVPDGVGAIVPDGVGAVVPDGVGAVVPGGVGVVDCVWFCAAMPSTDIADAKASAVVSLVSLRCIAISCSLRVLSACEKPSFFVLSPPPATGSTNVADSSMATRRVRCRRCARYALPTGLCS